MNLTVDWTRLTVVVVLAAVVGFLAHDHGDGDLAKAAMAALAAFAMGMLRSPTQTSRRATDAPPSEEKTP